MLYHIFISFWRVKNQSADILLIDKSRWKISDPVYVSLFHWVGWSNGKKIFFLFNMPHNKRCFTIFLSLFAGWKIDQQISFWSINGIHFTILFYMHGGVKKKFNLAHNKRSFTIFLSLFFGWKIDQRYPSDRYITMKISDPGIHFTILLCIVVSKKKFI